MTVYSAILDTQIDPDAPATSLLMYQMRDNPIAMAEGAVGAPYIAAGWHPYDGVTIGDGADGVIYDFDVDGAVASVQTPDFVDGYEYLILFKSLNQPASNRNISWYQETSASWGTAFGIGGTFPNDGFIEVTAPRMVSKTMFFRLASIATLASGTSQPVGADLHVLGMATAQKVLKAKIDAGASSFNGGKIYMLKRRCFVAA